MSATGAPSPRPPRLDVRAPARAVPCSHIRHPPPIRLHSGRWFGGSRVERGLHRRRHARPSHEGAVRRLAGLDGAIALADPNYLEGGLASLGMCDRDQLPGPICTRPDPNLENVRPTKRLTVPTGPETPPFARLPAFDDLRFAHVPATHRPRTGTSRHYDLTPTPHVQRHEPSLDEPTPRDETAETSHASAPPTHRSGSLIENEVVKKTPEGGAPPSTRLLDGPHFTLGPSISGRRRHSHKTAP